MRLALTFFLSLSIFITSAADPVSFICRRMPLRRSHEAREMSQRSRFPRHEYSPEDSDTSGVSFQPDLDGFEPDESSASTDLMVPDLPPHAHGRGRPLRRSRNARNPSTSNSLPDFSDDPNDDTDECQRFS